MLLGCLGSSSSKHPMHEPLRGGGAAAIEAGAVEPEVAAFSIFDDVIVARLLGRAAPPFRRDALGALRFGHLIEDAAPAELSRRPLRDERDDLRGLRA